MLSVSDFIRLRYTTDLTRAGIAYACRQLVHPFDQRATHDFHSLRQLVAQTAVELALKRYLIECKVPFDVMESNPFTDPDKVEICLAGRWCLINNTLLTRKDQVRLLSKDPSCLLTSSIMTSPGLFSTELYSPNDLYIISFSSLLPPPPRSELEPSTNQEGAAYLIQDLPPIWSNPVSSPALGHLALKSNLHESIVLELGGLGENREFQTESIDLLPGSRIETQLGFISIGYVHASHLPEGQIGIYSPKLGKSHLLKPTGWGNIWIDGLEIILVGYLELGEIQRRLRTSTRGWYSEPKTGANPHRNFLPVSTLRPLGILFNSVRAWSQKNRG